MRKVRFYVHSKLHRGDLLYNFDLSAIDKCTFSLQECASIGVPNQRQSILTSSHVLDTTHNQQQQTTRTNYRTTQPNSKPSIKGLFLV